jgi:carboxymethylenebutenolidase
MDPTVKSTWMELAPGYAGYLSLPPAGRGPGLLLLQEIFGVNEHIRAVAEQYALDGFVVLAPDLFWRQAPRVALGYEGADMARARLLMQAYTAEQAIADIGVAARTLRACAELNGPSSASTEARFGESGQARVGAVGYCVGGRMAWLAAATAGVDAAVAYYGGGLHLQLDRAASVRCPMLFHYAGHDDNIPPEAVESVRRALPATQAEVHVYPPAHHGFNCWARASYHAPSAALAHGRTLSFLATHLF